MACDHSTQSPSNSPGLRVSLAKCQSLGAVPKSQAAAPKEGNLIFSSPDSISFLINAILNCEAQYSFSAVVAEPDTLSMEAVAVGDSRSKCVCEKDMTIEFKAMNGENFSGIKTVKFASLIYVLSVE